MKLLFIVGGIVLLGLIILGSRKAWSNMDQRTKVELNNLYYGKEFSVKEDSKESDQ
ncbi:MAG: hypothetical protein KBS56_04325 [Clostridiales bacterium]|nr:hypothetical protein [Candidatus Crickella equi]